MIHAIIINKRRLPVLYALSLHYCVPNKHVYPHALIYIAVDCIMQYVFSLRVFKQMDAHKRARIHTFLHIHTHAPAFIHSF